MRSWNRIFTVGLGSLLALLLGACTSLPDLESAQYNRQDSIINLTPGHVASQTFTLQQPGLDGITLYLEPQDYLTTLLFWLVPGDGEGEPAYATFVQVSFGENRIPIPTQPHPAGQVYTLSLSLEQGAVQIFGRDEDAYPGGTASLDGQALPGDMAFQTSYTYDRRAAWTDLRSLVAHAGYALPLALLLFVPGWLLLERLPLYRQLDPGGRAAVSIGLSLVFTPLVLVWTSTLDLRWYPFSARVTAGLLGGMLVWRVTRRVKIHFKTHSLRHTLALVQPADFILPAILLLAIFIRSAMVRDVTMPAWVDSIHHALIANRILQEGRLPPNYLPHLPIEASRYHPGFHSLVVVFTWLSGLELPQAMLVLGQALNAATVLGVYLLATTLFRQRRIGWWAALITTALSLMPAYYTDWGRYTQLAGLLVLPALLRWVFPTHADPQAPSKKTPAHFLVGSLLFAGLFVIHYRVLFFLVCLIMAVWVARLFRRDRTFAISLATSVRDTAILGFLSILVALPWLIPALKEIILPLASGWGSQDSITLPGITWRYLTPVLGVPVMVLGLIGLVWGLYRRQWPALSLGLWVLLLFLFANPAYFHLPFPTGVINQTSVEILLFMPFSILAGYTLSRLQALGDGWRRPLLVKTWKGLFLALGLAAALVGAPRLIATLNPATILYRQADTAGIEWLENHIPPDEIVVINPVAWGYGLFMGQDGGYWISPLTGLRTLPPAVLYGLSRDDKEKVNTFAAQLIEAGEDPDAIWELLQGCSLRYIYLGARGGVLSPQALDQSPRFATLYHQDGVWVFEALPAP